MRIVVGITGASGSIYGVRLLEVLSGLGHELHTVVTRSGEKVMEHECGVQREGLRRFGRLYDVDDLFAPIASGSFRVDACAIIPCSMRTAGAISNGIADNLLTRSADVALKEGRRLILVPREAPLSAIHLDNLARLAHAGARIVPASPAFYHRPKTMDELVDFVVGKVLDVLEIPHNLFARWGKT